MTVQAQVALHVAASPVQLIYGICKAKPVNQRQSVMSNRVTDDNPGRASSRAASYLVQHYLDSNSHLQILWVARLTIRVCARQVASCISCCCPAMPRMHRMHRMARTPFLVSHLPHAGTFLSRLPRQDPWSAVARYMTATLGRHEDAGAGAGAGRCRCRWRCNALLPRERNCFPASQHAQQRAEKHTSTLGWLVGRLLGRPPCCSSAKTPLPVDSPVPFLLLLKHFPRNPVPVSVPVSVPVTVPDKTRPTSFRPSPRALQQEKESNSWEPQPDIGPGLSVMAADGAMDANTGPTSPLRPSHGSSTIMFLMRSLTKLTMIIQHAGICGTAPYPRPQLAPPLLGARSCLAFQNNQHTMSNLPICSPA